MSGPDTVENRTFDEIVVGDTASIVRTLCERDMQLFASVSGDANPVQLDPAYAAADLLHKVIAPSMWGGGLISAVLGTELPGPGMVYISQTLRFIRPICLGDTVTVSVTVTEKQAEHHIILDCLCLNQNAQAVIAGQAVVKAPTEKVCRPVTALPDIRISKHDGYRKLIGMAAGGNAIVTAVAHPCSECAILAAVEAAEAGLIKPILIGPEGKIREAAQKAGKDITKFRIVPAPHSHAAAALAVALVRSGEAQLLMKGSLHTDELMAAVVSTQMGLRTERRISHAYLMDAPGHPTPLIITDAAINIEPTLEEKADIVRNAVDLAHVIGIQNPKVAILSAVETVRPSMRSTIDAAALCKMADRGQISGAVLDGPLAFDNAISEAAATDKGIVSPVAGRAEILVVPNLEAGNMLAKQLIFLGGADAAGVVLGARVPIVLTSRADSLRTRLASCAVAVLLARAPTKAAPGLPEGKALP